MRVLLSFVLLWCLCGSAFTARAETEVIRIPRGAGGVGFLPLLIMEQRGLVERQARALGAANLKVDWIKLGGPAVVNDLLLSGAADIVVAGPPAFLTLWDRTRETLKVKGVAAMNSIPMYLNTRAGHLHSLKDLSANDKIAVTAVKVSIPAIIMQMAALKEFGPAGYAHYDPFTVSLTHADAVIALTSGRADITAHFASPPFHQRELKLPGVRTIMSSNAVMGGPSTFTLLYTTSRFHDANPKAFAAFSKALEEAILSLNADKRAAAQTFIDMEAQAMPLAEVMEVLADPDIRYTTTPENIMKYADFMATVGSLKGRPSTWQDLFFPGIHHVPGG
ncbi:MAG TPA: ABC transporter substrate-binding protein [Hyphomicrobiaceae bacterium]|jgi:NitT/TauT family transport system substrate-binding protein|nr:ABC transporter substrate-binding protein [Hyphomicrobiaceae bacterium]